MEIQVDQYRFRPGSLKPLEGFRRLDDYQDRLRPYFRSDEEPGYWVFAEHELILEAMQQPELFSNAVIVPIDPNPAVKFIPMNQDPPEHTKWRRLLGGYFTPKRVETMQEKQREFARDLIERMAGNGRGDFHAEFAKRFPTTIFLQLMGLPVGELDRFLTWEHRILHGTEEDDPDRQIRTTAVFEVIGYFQELIAKRRTQPESRGDDIVSHAIGWEIDGEPVQDQDLLSCMLLLFMAGLDTVTAQLSYIFHHLATHPDDRRRLVEDPDLVPHAVEEFMRAYPIVATARKVTRDTEFHGCPFKEGDVVAMPLGMAGRDPDTQENAREVDLDRKNVRHISFGAGPHHCLGAHLARQELKIALQEWHELIPDYRIPADEEITEHNGGVFGLDRLPLEWPLS